MRLHKFLAQAGVASRRHAEQMIRAGRVTVNGQTIAELGQQIDPEKDRVTVDGQPVVAPEVRTTIVLHKPIEAVTTMSDPQGRRTVASLIAEEPYRLVPIGRLDYHTEGVLLLTTDGDLAHRLLHPRWKIPKIYLVKVAGQPRETDLDRLRKGVELDDGPTQPAVVEMLESQPRQSWIELVLTEGRQRQVRRMCEAIGHRALRVVRTSFATISVEDLKPGQYRYLSRAELAMLYRLVGLDEIEPAISERARQHGSRPLGQAERSRGPLPGEASGSRVRSRRGADADRSRDREERRARGVERAERYHLRPRASRDDRDARGARARFSDRRSAEPRERSSDRRSAEPRGRFSDRRSAEPRERSSDRRGAEPRGRFSDRRSAEPRERSSDRRSAEPRGRFSDRRSAEPRERSSDRRGAEPRGRFSDRRSAEPRGRFSDRRGAEPRGRFSDRRGAEPRERSSDRRGAEPREQFSDRRGAEPRGRARWTADRPARSGDPRRGAPRGRGRFDGPGRQDPRPGGPRGAGGGGRPRRGGSRPGGRPRR